MKKRIKGLIIAALLLVCMAIPVSAAVGKYDFQQKSVSVQVGKSKNLYVCNNGKTINPKKFHWKSSNPKVISVTNGKLQPTIGEMQRYMRLATDRRYVAMYMLIGKVFQQVLKDIVKEPQ